METEDEIRFRAAMLDEDFEAAKNICADREGETTSDLSAAVFMIAVERGLLKRAFEKEEISLPEIARSFDSKTAQEMGKIIEAKTDELANHSRVKALRYSEARLLLHMLLEENWSESEWKKKSHLTFGVLKMIERVDLINEPQAVDPEILAVSWEDYHDDQSPKDEKDESGEHRRLTLVGV
jgi:hypothetical protein